MTNSIQHREHARDTIVPSTLTLEEASRRLASLAVHIHEESRTYTSTLFAFLHAHQILEHAPPVAMRWTESDQSEQLINYAKADVVVVFHDEASRLLDELDLPPAGRASPSTREEPGER
jgi:hypothetical protein